jgi:hypothetical protein
VQSHGLDFNARVASLDRQEFDRLSQVRPFEICAVLELMENLVDCHNAARIASSPRNTSARMLAAVARLLGAG